MRMPRPLYKPKYETSIAEIAKENPISSVLSMGIVPVVGAAAGKILETGRAMISDTGDPMTMVKGRTQQMASELSDYTSGQAGKPTNTNIAAPLAPTIKPQPITALPVNYPAMRNKFIADGQSQPVAAQTPIVSDQSSQRNPSGTETKSQQQVTAAPIQSAGERIHEYKTPGITNISENSLVAGLAGDNAAYDASRKQDITAGISTQLSPEEIKNYNIGTNGGIASMDGKTFVLPSRGVDEEKQFQAQLAQNSAAQPITSIAQPSQQTTTVGYGNGIETYSGDGRLLSSTRKLDGNSSITDIAMAKINNKLENQAAQTRNYDTDSGYKKMLIDKGIITTPHDIADTQAQTRERDARTKEIFGMMGVKQDNFKSEAEKNRAMSSFYTGRLKLLKEAAQNPSKLSVDDPDHAIRTKALNQFTELNKHIIDPISGFSEQDQKLAREHIKQIQGLYTNPGGPLLATKRATQHQPQSYLTED